MPLFHLDGKKLNMARPINFKYEKEIQTLIESNLEIVFNCKFIASEFSTGNEHAGRIDTLALSEENNPVIIEYKKVASSELINQSLYYLSWIKDHKGDFQVIVNKAIGKNTEVDWNDIRVICIAPEYKKFDLHAVQMMGANIELWRYKLYDTDTLHLEEIFRRDINLTKNPFDEKGKNPIMVEAGKKAAITRQTGFYTIDEHLNNVDEKTKKLLRDLRDYILDIDESIEETPKKFYIAYKVSQNFVCIKVRKNRIALYLKLNPKEIQLPKNGRDVSAIEHSGTGDLEMIISNDQELEESKEYIKKSYDNIGG